MSSEQSSYYDVCIVGGGLAGLSSAIELSRKGLRVILFEKEKYPFHKVCGEYISLESWDFLISLGVQIDQWCLPTMTRLQLTSSQGSTLTHELPLGGFGISRHRLDNALADRARAEGALVRDGCKVDDVQYQNEVFSISAEGSIVTAKLCMGAFGKRSSLDIKWGRKFVRQKPDALNNYVGVKYHAMLDHPRDLIALHNFPGGYCGIAAIEDGMVNICYHTSAGTLRRCGNNIARMEKETLFQNPFLAKAFRDAKFTDDKPLVISQISFAKKERVHEHVLLTGDAAGLIAPLSGNGMSMALRSGALASSLMIKFMAGEIDRSAMEKYYNDKWRGIFAARLSTGRLLQRIFYHPSAGSAAIRLLKPFPYLSKQIIKRTHGRPWHG